MSVKYFCDECGKELLLPMAVSNVVSNNKGYANTDGYKTYVRNRGWLDLCNECRNKMFKDRKDIIGDSYGSMYNSFM